MLGKLARQPNGPPDHSPIWRERQRRLRNGSTERQYGHGFYGNGYGNGYGERKRKAGNQVLLRVRVQAAGAEDTCPSGPNPMCMCLFVFVVVSVACTSQTRF